MDKIQVFLFPNYVTMETLMRGSPNIWKFFANNNVKLVVKHWDGTPVSLLNLPTDKMLLIRSSAMMKCSRTDLHAFCKNHRHLSFFDYQLLTEDGSYTEAGLIEALTEFLERVRQAQ